MGRWFDGAPVAQSTRDVDISIQPAMPTLARLLGLLLKMQPADRERRVRRMSSGAMGANDAPDFTEPNTSERDRLATELTDQEREVLASMGSLQTPMPAFEQRASTRTAAAAAQMLAESLTVREAAAVLGLSDRQIRYRFARRRLLGVRTATGWRLPRFQFRGSAVLRGLEQVLAAFPEDVHPLAVQRFLHTPHMDLSHDGKRVSPATWLEAGGERDVVAALIRGTYVLP